MWYHRTHIHELCVTCALSENWGKWKTGKTHKRLKNALLLPDARHGSQAVITLLTMYLLQTKTQTKLLKPSNIEAWLLLWLRHKQVIKKKHHQYQDPSCFQSQMEKKVAPINTSRTKAKLGVSNQQIVLFMRKSNKQFNRQYLVILPSTVINTFFRPYNLHTHTHTHGRKWPSINTGQYIQQIPNRYMWHHRTHIHELCVTCAFRKLGKMEN